MPGLPVYLRVIDPNPYKVIILAATSAILPLTSPLNVGSYDGGNNLLTPSTDALVGRTVTATLLTGAASLLLNGSSGAGVVLSGGLSQTSDPLGFFYFGAGASQPLMITGIVSLLVVKFISFGLTPVTAVIQIVEGGAGAQLLSLSPVLSAPGGSALPSAAVTPLPAFLVAVLDGGGNLLGLHDRLVTGDNAAPSRTLLLACSSAAAVSISSSANLSSLAATAETLNTGIANFSNVALLSPVAGNLTCTVSEVPRPYQLREQPPPLAPCNLTILVGPGPAVSLALPAALPPIVISASLGSVNTTTELTYDDDRGPPLPVLVVQVLDAGGNPVPGLNGSLAASLDDGDRSIYPFVTGYAAMQYHQAVLGADPYRVGGLTFAVKFNTSSSTAAFGALRAVRPPARNMTLTFSASLQATLGNGSVVPVSSESVPLRVVLGRSHHIGLPLPCPAWPLPRAGNGSCIFGSNCTCNQYPSTAETSLGAIQAVVLDAGENVVGPADTAACSADSAACSPRLVRLFVGSDSSGATPPVLCQTLVYPPSPPLPPSSPPFPPPRPALPAIRSPTALAQIPPPSPPPSAPVAFAPAPAPDLAPIAVSTSDVSAPCICTAHGASLLGVPCLFTTPWLETVAVNGTASFAGLVLLAPYVSQSLPLVISSSGILPVSFALRVFPGPPSALMVVPPGFFPPPATSASTYISNYSTALTGIEAFQESLMVVVVDAGGNHINDTESRGRIVQISCTTAILAPYPQGPRPADGVVVGGVDYTLTCNANSPGSCINGEVPGQTQFRNITLIRPPVGLQAINFTSPGLLPAAFLFTINTGSAASLIVADFAQNVSLAAAITSLGAITLAVVDPGGNRLGALNQVEYTIQAVMVSVPTNCTAAASATSGACSLSSSVGQDQATLLAGVDTVVLPTPSASVSQPVQVIAPVAGLYQLAFTVVCYIASCDPGYYLSPAFFSFSVAPGAAAQLAAPGSPCSNGGSGSCPFNGVFLPLAFHATRQTVLSSFTITVQDGGGNTVGAGDLDPVSNQPMQRLVTAHFAGAAVAAEVGLGP